jgi:hypothetical protein
LPFNEAEVRKAAREKLERDAELDPCQRRADAEVRSLPKER